MQKRNIEDARIEIENCEACAIARQYADVGETMLCKKHYENFSDIEGKILVTTYQEKDEVDQWFIERAQEFEFHPFVTTCSMCFKREAFYVGVTAHGTPFEFCRICRDDLVRRADAAKQLPERFGV